MIMASPGVGTGIIINEYIISDSFIILTVNSSATINKEIACKEILNKKNHMKRYVINMK